MRSKKIMGLILASALVFVGCTSEPAEEPGTTTETPAGDEGEEGFTGTKTLEKLYDATGSSANVVVATVEFKNGAPVDVSIDVRQADGRMKVEQSEAGEYIMAEGEENALHEQYIMLEDFIVENSFDLSKVNLSDDAGHTDAVSGVSIKVSRYLEVVQELITTVENGEEVPTGFTGVKTVETPYSEESEAVVVTTVKFENAEPKNVSIDVRQEDGTMKVELSEAGEYIMGGEYLLHEQYAMLEDFIVENNFDLTKVNLIDEDGHTDVVSGVSIKVSAYLEGVQAALDEVN